MSTPTLLSEALSETIFHRSRLFVWRFGLAIFPILFGLVAFFIRPSSDTVILRYNVFFGVDLLGVWWQAHLVPGICLAFFIGNLIFAELLFRRGSRLAALILVYGSVVVAVSGALATATLLFINS